MKDRYCSSCNVEVSSDLTNCPLCGKYIAKNQKATVNENSYPVYDLKFVQTAKWYNIIRVLFWLAAVCCVVINLVEPTREYWFPYVLAALVMLFYVFIRPIKVTVKSYIKSLTAMSVVVAIFVIFVDWYNHFSFGTKFGWSVTYAAPFVMFAGVLAAATISFCYKRYENELIRSVAFMGILSVVYFIVIALCFNFPLWPSLTFMCTSVGLVVVLELFKRRRILENLSHEFHI